MKRAAALASAAVLLLASGACGGKTAKPGDDIASDLSSVTGSEYHSEEPSIPDTTGEEQTEEPSSEEPGFTVSEITVNADSGVVSLESGLSAAEFRGNYGLDGFIDAGGAKSDDDVAAFLIQSVLDKKVDLTIDIPSMGCSTMSVPGKNGGNYFGRNFDWNTCDALILRTTPSDGYVSVSTINTDFIKENSPVEATGDLLKFAAIYAPLDGMNEKGLCVSVNMVSDGDKVEQSGAKTDVTTTTAVRILLDKAKDVDEAVGLLKSFNMHFSYGYAIHFALSDADGNAAVAEYVNGKLIITESPVLTNHSLALGTGGRGNSGARMRILTEEISKKGSMSADDVRAALKRAGKKNFSESDSQYRSTEWSVIYDQKNMTATYFHREDFDKAHTIKVGQ